MGARAFTLVEVVLVVALLGLLVGATTLSLARTAQRGSWEHAVGRVADADRMARLTAQRLGEPCVLAIDLDGHRMRRQIGAERGDQTASHAVELPAGVRIDQVLVCSQRGVGRTDSGTAEVAFSTGGRSASYAVKLTTGNDDTTQWLVVLGLTGQVITDIDENMVDQLFSALSTGRLNAD